MEAAFATQAKLRQELGLKKVMAVPNQNYKRHGTKSYVYLMNRFGFKATKPGPYQHSTTFHHRGLAGSHVARGGRLRREHKLVKTTSSGETGEVTAEDQQNDSEYLCEVQIGTPAQTLKLDFDTGSSDLWVFSTELPSKDQTGHNIFDPSKSSTWQTSEGLSWKISYGDGSSASGDVGTDTVNIGGVTITNQSVELAKTAAAQFISGTGDGLLGLAFPSINTITKSGQADPQNTPVANMISQGDIPSDAQLFTSAFYSSRDQAANSFYTFGYIDTDLVGSNTIHYTDIDNSEGFWMFDSTTYTIAGTQGTQASNQAICDTGTTLCLLADEVVEALYDAIPGSKYDETQQGYLFPTSVTADQLPDFSVAVGDQEFTIQKEDLAFTVASEGYWYGGVQSRGDNPFDILGDVFLKSVYVIWDQGNTRLGLVPKIESTQNLDPTTSSTS
ncbi:aspartyl proteinase [Cryphonectria parasitica EP155]|uniref:Aspartyl proteinase n=1 Tax=Cryphonectria parasitica (strain ATCC 38755 / EP155) TaxID=660469 RepID=A0A9P5CJW8_CRYP1|nr:aspartyl proteinase [Cryphonectria parasitica EP155]KAF3760562.1 aspartyl proteinase [Cryphonectria parasitica EP155]